MQKIYTKLQRTLVELIGADKEEFLQGIMTNDICKLDKQGIIYSCILSPQGKFLYDIYVFRLDDKLLIDVYSEVAKEMVTRLEFFKLESRVEIKFLSNEHSIIFANAPSNEHICYADPRNAEFGYRIYLLNGGALEDYMEDANYYLKKRIEMLVPDGAEDLIKDKSFILEYGLDKLDAVDFKKGCYTGQEVTARTKYRGIIRKHIYKIKINGQTPQKHEDLVDNGRKIGKICAIYENFALALIRDENLGSLKEVEIVARLN